MSASATDRAPQRTSADVLVPGEELVTIRAATWRLLVPLRHVERVLGAAMPAARAGVVPGNPVVAVGGELLPVVFAGALVGAEEITLRGAHQMVLLASGGRRALLWVDAVEDLVEHTPVPEPPSGVGGDLVLAWSGAERPLAVLDVARVLALA